MSSTELVWLVVRFSVLPIAVLVIGFALLWRRSSMKVWRNYAWLLGVAVIAWCGLVLIQSSFGLSEGTDAEEVVPAIAYYFWPVFSLGGIVVGGSFWYLVGRTAALERESLLRGT
jgi:hypothetical protein